MSHDAGWIGRERVCTDLLDPWRATALAATLDIASVPFAAGDPLPILWHWLYFIDPAPAASLGPDGHPRRGGFLPPTPLPRRMFAGARTQVLHPLRLGVPAIRRETILAVAEKIGPHGPRLFVTLSISIAQDGRSCLHEEQDIVYLGERPARPARPEAAIPPAPWCRMVMPDAVMLFRFSALTFNAHRIHFDRDYARNEEGYPDRVVHGPLTAILLAELARAELGHSLTELNFRATVPLFCGGAITLTGKPEPGGTIRLAAHDPDGNVAVSATGYAG